MRADSHRSVRPGREPRGAPHPALRLSPKLLVRFFSTAEPRDKHGSTRHERSGQRCWTNAGDKAEQILIRAAQAATPAQWAGAWRIAGTSSARLAEAAGCSPGRIGGRCASGAPQRDSACRGRRPRRLAGGTEALGALAPRDSKAAAHLECWSRWTRPNGFHRRPPRSADQTRPRARLPGGFMTPANAPGCALRGAGSPASAVVTRSREGWCRIRCALGAGDVRVPRGSWSTPSTGGSRGDRTRTGRATA